MNYFYLLHKIYHQATIQLINFMNYICDEHHSSLFIYGSRVSQIFIISQLKGSCEVNNHNGRIDEVPILVIDIHVRKFMIILICNETMA